MNISRTLAASAAAFCLAVGSVAIALPASADEAPPAEAAVEVIAPVEAPAPEAAPVADAAKAPAPEAKPERKATVCHDGNALEVAVSAVPAHLAHGDNEGACVAPPVVVVPEPPVVVPPPVTDTGATKTLRWVLPNGGTADNVTWDQPVYSPADVPCATTVTIQVDVYPYGTPDAIARTDALDDDGFLRYGEDHGWAKSWSFETYTAPACVVVPPVVVPPVVVVPEKPADVVTTEVSTTCGDGSLGSSITTVVTTTVGHELVGNVWVPLAPVVTTESHTATPDELNAIPEGLCGGVVVPEPEAPAVVAPPALTPVTAPPAALVSAKAYTPASGVLAHTGSDQAPLLWGALIAAVLMLGGSALVATRIIQNRPRYRREGVSS